MDKTKTKPKNDNNKTPTKTNSLCCKRHIHTHKGNSKKALKKTKQKMLNHIRIRSLYSKCENQVTNLYTYYKLNFILKLCTHQLHTQIVK